MLTLGSNPGYLERKEEAAVLRSLLEGPGRVVLVAGPAGMGKTSLVHMLASRHASQFPGGTCLMNAPWERNGSLEQALAHIAKQVAIPSARSLLILDDIDVPDISGKPTDLTFLPYAAARFPELRVLATARHVAQLSIPMRSTVITLEGLSNQEVEQLVEKRNALFDDIPDGSTDLAKGNQLLVSMLRELMSMRKITPRDVLQSLYALPRSCLVDTFGRPLTAAAPNARGMFVHARAVHDELLSKIRKQPSMVYSLTPREFEEITATLFERLGYKVELTPQSKDGGRDLYVARNDEIGKFMYYVECKKYSPEYPIGVGLVRQLYGTIEADKVTAGIMLSTSRFTKAAREFECNVQFRLSLRDYVEFQVMLSKAGF